MILFISYSGMFGGAERQLVDVAAGLPGERLIACPEGSLAAAAREAGLRVLPLTWRSLHMRLTIRDRAVAPVRLLSHALEVRRLIERLGPELVIAWGMRDALACGLALLRSSKRARFVFQHNDLLPGSWLGRLVRVVAGRAAVVVVPSLVVARDLDPLGRLGDRLAVVHPGIDVARFAVDRPPRATPTVLVIGALVEWKRPDLALEALALLRRRRPDVRMILAGAPIERGRPLLDRLRQRASQPDLAGAVELLGEVADPSELLSQCAALLHCAEREPFGLAVVEAMASGRPVVVPHGSGPAEVVDESCAMLYRPGDAGDAADKLLGLLADPEHGMRMGAAGRARASERFDRASSRTEYAAVLRPLLGARSMLARKTMLERLAIVTVTHNSAQELRSMLESVARHLAGVQVVVVDNDSADATVAVARRWAGAATVLEADENLGFGRACNWGLGAVEAPVTALLNPDVELLDDSVLQLAAEVLRDDRAPRILAPLILGPGGSPQDSVHPAPASRAELLGALIPPAALPGRLAAGFAPWRATRPRRVGWAIGAALVARTETLSALGPFDERIFLYGEDMELCMRAAEAGVETWFWPFARVLHRGAHSRQAAFGGEPFELLASARREVVARRLGARAVSRDDAMQAITFASRRALKRALGRPAERERRQLAALASARRAA